VSRPTESRKRGRRLPHRLAFAVALAFAACSAAPEAPAVPETPWANRAEHSIDAARILGSVRSMVEFGQRWYGAPRRDAAIERLVEALRSVTDSVSREEIEREEPISKISYRLVNLVGRLRPEASRRVLLASHWDTRLWAEEDPDPARRGEPIPGANDGTSGVAVVLEVARVLREHGPRDLGLDVALFDGEEFGRPGSVRYCQGSTAFSADLARWYPNGKPVAAIVVDMVGDRDLHIRREGFSVRSAGWLVDLVWKHGRAIRPDVFPDETGSSILDDQVPLQRAGIPAVLLIDLDYPYWHTHADTVDKVDAANARDVARVLLRSIAELSEIPR